MLFRRPSVLIVGLLALTAPVPTAEATPPTAPWSADLGLDGPPRTGSSVSLTVEVTANTDLDTTFRLELPDHVRSEDEREWEVSLAAGETATRRWDVSIGGRGFWYARLAETGNETLKEAACCLYAYSDPGQGLAGAEASEAMPEPRAVTETSFEVAGPGTVEGNYSVNRQAPWMRFGEFVLEHSVDGAGAETRAEEGRARAPHAFEVDLADGQRETVFVTSRLEVGFEGAEGESRHGVFVHCRNVQIERDGGEVERLDDWGCIAHADRAARPTGPPEDRASAPLPGPLAVAAALAAAGSWARKRRP